MKKRMRLVIIITVIIIFLYSAFDVFRNSKKPELSDDSGSPSETTTYTEPDYWSDIKEVSKNNIVSFVLLGITGTIYIICKYKQRKKESEMDELIDDEKE